MAQGVGRMATKRSVGTLSEADLKGKKVFLRADLNVPLDDSQKITDDTRIRASVPTIKFLMEKGAKVILASHLVSSGFFDLCILIPKGCFWRIRVRGCGIRCSFWAIGYTIALLI